jgi:hypothetical protein
VLWLVLASALVALTAALLIGPLELESRLERVVAVLLVATSEIFVVSFTSAWFSWYRPLPLLLFCAGLAAIAVGAALRRRAFRSLAPPRINAAKAAAWWRGPSGVLLVLLSLLCLVQLVWALIRALRLPPYGWDALWYHLVAVAQFVQSGSLEPSGLNPYADSYPRTGELLAAWLAVFPGSDALVPVAQVGFAVLGALATVGIARTVGVTGVGASIAGMLYFLTPIVLAQAATAYVDVTLAAFQVASLYFLMRGLFTESPGASGSRASEVRFVLAGLSLGLAVGTKPTAVVWTALSVVTVAVVCAVGHRVWKDAGRAVAVVAGVAIMIGCPWYVLNMIRFGNPVYPISVDFAGLHLPGLISATDLRSEPPVPGLWEPLQAVRSWLSDLALGVHGIRGFGLDERQGGFGPAFALVGIPATVIAAARALRHRNTPWLVLVAMIAAQFALQPYRWWSRFTIVLVVVAAVAIGALLQRGVKYAGPVVVSALVAGCVVWSQPFLLLRVPLGDEAFASAQDMLGFGTGAPLTGSGGEDVVYGRTLDGARNIAVDAEHVYRLSPLFGSNLRRDVEPLDASSPRGALEAAARSDVVVTCSDTPLARLLGSRPGYKAVELPSPLPHQVVVWRRTAAAVSDVGLSNPRPSPPPVPDLLC